MPLAVLALVLAVAAVVRAETEATPPIALRRTLPAVVRLRGGPFHPAWPRQGQAAAVVEGLGSLGTSGPQSPVPIASVAKTMTAYLTLKQFPLRRGQEGFWLTITPGAVDDLHRRIALDESVVNVRAGERLSERQALEALMLPSANNVAALLAVHDAGSIGAFVAEMNAAAARLGMRHTHYTDPSGFEKTTVSTATDQIKLARAALANPTFAQIVAMPAVRLPVAGRVVNYDELVGHEGFVGVKTGSDEAAGGCLLFARRIHVDGRELTMLGAVFGQRHGGLVEAALASASQLAGSVAAAVGVEPVVPAGTRVMVARGPDGRGVAATAAAPLRQLGWPGMPVRVRVLTRPPGHTLGAGERVATLIAPGVSPSSTAVVARKAVSGPSLTWRLEHLL